MKKTDFKKAFTYVYDNKVWGEGSGGGSSYENNTEYINFLQAFLKEKYIRTVLDFGCGDWQFSQYIDWGDFLYLGIDAVESVVSRNSFLYQKTNISFFCAEDLDFFTINADLLLIKDVFQHWKDEDIKEFLKKNKKKFKYVLCTNTINGHWKHETEEDLITRPIDANTGVLAEFGFKEIKRIEQNKTDIKQIALLTNI